MLIAVSLYLLLASCLILAARSTTPGRAQRFLERTTGLQIAAAALLGLAWLAGDAGGRTVALGPAALDAAMPWLPSVRLDGLSAILAILVSGLGHAVVRYSRRYLNGEPGRLGFLRALGATLAPLSLFVVAGDLLTMTLSWVVAGRGLDRLLAHRSERAAAWHLSAVRQRAGRIATTALLGAVILTALSFDTLDPVAIAASSPAPWIVGVIALAIAFAALAMSVQPPFHGWLVESMEAVTPVSALLHAGVVNGGGLLLIRSAPLFEGAPWALAIPLVMGAATAAIGTLVMCTQTDIKRKLACSTVAQMGFMLMQCGLGAFTAAAFHLVAHALYKAYAFLSAGAHVGPAGEPARALPFRWTPLVASLAFGAGAAYAAHALLGVDPGAKTGGWAITAVFAVAVAQLLLYERLRSPATRPAGAVLAIGVALPLIYLLGFGLFARALGLPTFPALEAPLFAEILVASFFVAAAAIQLAAWCRPAHPLMQRAYVFLRTAPARAALEKWTAPRPNPLIPHRPEGVL